MTSRNTGKYTSKKKNDGSKNKLNQAAKQRPDVGNFRLAKKNAPLVKLIKHQKHPDDSDVLNNVLMIFRKLGFKGFSKRLQKTF